MKLQKIQVGMSMNYNFYSRQFKIVIDILLAIRTCDLFWAVPTLCFTHPSKPWEGLCFTVKSQKYESVTRCNTWKKVKHILENISMDNLQ
jgi:hypothetical protein